mgnify:FL=1
MSGDDVETERSKVVEDVKRMAQLEATSQPQQPTEPQSTEPATQEPEQPETPDEEQQIDDVDTILASLGEPEEESDIEDEELEEAKMGRPRTGMSYGQDSHPRGRDPLGHEENKDALVVKKRRNDKRKSPLALEMQRFLDKSSLNKKPSSVLLENKESTGSMLDESNILDLEK